MPDLSNLDDVIYRSCVASVVKASGGAITDRDAKDLLKNLNGIKKMVIAATGNGSASLADIKDKLPQVLADRLGQIKVGRLQKQVQIVKQGEAFSGKVTKYEMHE